MRKHILVVITAMVVVLALATIAMAADPFVGTWKLNVAKSKFNPGPPPKSWTVKIEAVDNGLRNEGDVVNADGKATHLENTFRFDGKDFPVPSATGGVGACKGVGTSTFTCVLKKEGKETGRIVDSISKDGKTGTLTIKDKNEQGRDINNTYVWDKQ